MITAQAQASHEHSYDDATGEPAVCPVYGCWFNRDFAADMRRADKAARIANSRDENAHPEPLR